MTKTKKEQSLEILNRLKTKEVETFATLQRKQHLDSLKPRDNQATQDIERQRIKMQRKCKHTFNKITRQCNYCGKARSAHI